MIAGDDIEVITRKGFGKGLMTVVEGMMINPTVAIDLVFRLR